MGAPSMSPFRCIPLLSLALATGCGDSLPTDNPDNPDNGDSDAAVGPGPDASEVAVDAGDSGPAPCGELGVDPAEVFVDPHFC